MFKCKIQQEKTYSWKKNQTHEIFTLLHSVKLFYLTKPKGFKDLRHTKKNVLQKELFLF